MDEDKLQRQPGKRKKIRVTRRHARVLKPDGTRYSDEEMAFRSWSSRFSVHLREQFDAGLNWDQALDLAGESFDRELSLLTAANSIFDATEPRALLPQIKEAARKDWDRWNRA